MQLGGGWLLRAYRAPILLPTGTHDWLHSGSPTPPCVLIISGPIPILRGRKLFTTQKNPAASDSGMKGDGGGGVGGGGNIARATEHQDRPLELTTRVKFLKIPVRNRANQPNQTSTRIQLKTTLMVFRRRSCVDCLFPPWSGGSDGGAWADLHAIIFGR